MSLTDSIKVTVLLAVTFAAGITVGVTYERRHAPAHDSPITEAHDAMSHLIRELGLDPDQQRAVAHILKTHQTEVDAAWHAMQPQVAAALKSMSSEILSVLRPEQAEKYRWMLERRHGSQPH